MKGLASDGAAGARQWRAGDRIADRFELVAEAGRGGMGVVYRAYDHRTENEVARAWSRA